MNRHSRRSSVGLMLFSADAPPAGEVSSCVRILSDDSVTISEL